MEEVDSEPRKISLGRLFSSALIFVLLFWISIFSTVHDELTNLYIDVINYGLN